LLEIHRVRVGMGGLKSKYRGHKKPFLPKYAKVAVVPDLIRRRRRRSIICKLKTENTGFPQTGSASIRLARNIIAVLSNSHFYLTKFLQRRKVDQLGDLDRGPIAEEYKKMPLRSS